MRFSASPRQFMPRRLLLSAGRIVIFCGRADTVRSAELGIAYCELSDKAADVKETKL
jgi:hypothetical protein